MSDIEEELNRQPHIEYIEYRITASPISRDAASKTDSELWMAVYVSNLARIGAKICENAFQTIP